MRMVARPIAAPTRPRGALSLLPISELTRRNSSGNRIAATRIAMIHGSIEASQSAWILRWLIGQKSMTPSDWQASRATCARLTPNSNAMIVDAGGAGALDGFGRSARYAAAQIAAI